MIDVHGMLYSRQTVFTPFETIGLVFVRVSAFGQRIIQISVNVFESWSRIASKPYEYLSFRLLQHYHSLFFEINTTDLQIARIEVGWLFGMYAEFVAPRLLPNNGMYFFVGMIWVLISHYECVSYEIHLVGSNCLRLFRHSIRMFWIRPSTLAMHCVIYFFQWNFPSYCFKEL